MFNFSEFYRSARRYDVGDNLTKYDVNVASDNEIAVSKCHKVIHIPRKSQTVRLVIRHDYHIIDNLKFTNIESGENMNYILSANELVIDDYHYPLIVAGMMFNEIVATINIPEGPTDKRFVLKMEFDACFVSQTVRDLIQHEPIDFPEGANPKYRIWNGSLGKTLPANDPLWARLNLLYKTSPPSPSTTPETLQPVYKISDTPVVSEPVYKIPEVVDLDQYIADLDQTARQARVDTYNLSDFNVEECDDGRYRVTKRLPFYDMVSKFRVSHPDITMRIAIGRHNIDDMENIALLPKHSFGMYIDQEFYFDRSLPLDTIFDVTYDSYCFPKELCCDIAMKGARMSLGDKKFYYSARGELVIE
jgi:hypothetical protein